MRWAWSGFGIVETRNRQCSGNHVACTSISKGRKMIDLIILLLVTLVTSLYVEKAIASKSERLTNLLWCIYWFTIMVINLIQVISKIH